MRNECPMGEDSWCGWQRAAVTKEPKRYSYKPFPRDVLENYQSFLRRPKQRCTFKEMHQSWSSGSSLVHHQSDTSTAYSVVVYIHIHIHIHKLYVYADVIFNNNKELENNNFNTLSDDIYLDDQDVSEGSGRGGGEVRDDLEASGSGLGPDDEDGDERELAHYNESSEKKTIDTQKFEESQYKDIEVNMIHVFT
uniref:Uncharacterized protein n=1 Tax=Trichogramma kaykai TaxID=54128 RepID=A0ABD2WDJ2_9HYME